MKLLRFLAILICINFSSLYGAETNEPPRYATITNSIFSNNIIMIKDGSVEEMWGESIVYVRTNVLILKMTITNHVSWHTFNLADISKIEGIDDRCSEITFGRGKNISLVTLLNSDIKKTMDMKRKMWKKKNEQEMIR